MEEREPRTRRGRAAAFKRRKAGVLRQIQQVVRLEALRWQFSYPFLGFQVGLAGTCGSRVNRFLVLVQIELQYQLVNARRCLPLVSLTMHDR